MKRKIIKIDKSQCNGCGACAASCPTGSLKQVFFPDLSEEKQGHKGMGQFVCELHDPVHIMAHSRNDHKKQKHSIRKETGYETYIVTFLTPIPFRDA